MIDPFIHVENRVQKRENEGTKSLVRILKGLEQLFWVHKFVHTLGQSLRHGTCMRKQEDRLEVGLYCRHSVVQTDHLWGRLQK